MPQRSTRIFSCFFSSLLVCLLLSTSALADSFSCTLSRSTTGALSRVNNTPYSTSTAIVGAYWLTTRYNPVSAYADTDGNFISWSDDGYAYWAGDGGGAMSGSSGFHKGLAARITGQPPCLGATFRGDVVFNDGSEPGNYNMGFTSAHGVLYGTVANQYFDIFGTPYWAEAPGRGIKGIAYSTNHGTTWIRGSTFRPFGKFANDQASHLLKAPDTAFMSFVQFGQDALDTNPSPPHLGNVNPSDGQIYGLAPQGMWNYDSYYLGRVNPGTGSASSQAAIVTDPTKWQWYKGGGVWSTLDAGDHLSEAVPVLSWTTSLPTGPYDGNGNLSKPVIFYVPGANRYLLMTWYSYVKRTPSNPDPYTDPDPGNYNAGSELLILESQALTGPWNFVAREAFFGYPSGYNIGILPQTISSDGREMWITWTANWTGCNNVVHQQHPELACDTPATSIGMNQRKLHLLLAGDSTAPAVQNPGFESGVLGPWIPYNGSETVVSGQARTGTYAVRLPGVGTDVEQVIANLTPSSSYTLQCYGKVAIAGQRIRAGVYAYDSLGSDLNQSVSATSYSPITIQFTTGPSNTTAIVYFWRTTGDGSSAAYGDDCSVTASGGPTVQNPGFETGSLSPWVPYPGGPAESVVSGQGRSPSTYAAQLPAPGTAGSEIEQLISGLTPSASYVLRAWGKTASGASERIRFGVYDYGGPDNPVSITNSTSYAQACLVFTMGAANTSAKIYSWRTTGDGTANAYADDFTLVQGASC